MQAPPSSDDVAPSNDDPVSGTLESRWRPPAPTADALDALGGSPDALASPAAPASSEVLDSPDAPAPNKGKKRTRRGRRNRPPRHVRLRRRLPVPHGRSPGHERSPSTHERSPAVERSSGHVMTAPHRLDREHSPDHHVMSNHFSLASSRWAERSAMRIGTREQERLPGDGPAHHQRKRSKHTHSSNDE